MLEQTLNGAWEFRQVGKSEWFPAVVPGGVHTDLMAAGLIPDPFARDNERSVQWVAESDWEYRRAFVPVAPDIIGQEIIFLVCDGLDTLAEVRLNGVLLGTTENMFRRHQWNVKGLLRPGENEISILFHSPVQYVTRLFEERPLPGAIEWIKGGQYIRKSPSHFGWDWGPHLPAIGIWKDIRLEAGRVARLEDVHLRQEHEDARVTLTAEVAVEAWENKPLEAYLAVTSPGGQAWNDTVSLVNRRGLLTAVIDHPQLWWPNGCGPQPLYRVEVTLMSGERLLDSKTYHVGLHTKTLLREPDQWGESFYFVINGLRVFAKGSNWIPSDSFPTRISPEQYEHLIASAAATNQNMLRVWGGGFYESDLFYELCDRYGILVWHDFMFSCNVYPLDIPSFVENVHQEVIDNVRRIRHHASLALWCGNNEMDIGWAGWGWFLPDTIDLRGADEHFFHHLLPEWVAALDPDTPYWPSSPTSGTPPESPNGGSRGDVHQWEVWHGLRPFSNYLQVPARFVSEFGFQSLPDLPTVATYAPPEEWNMTSYLMEYHQRHPRGNGIIVTYMLDRYRLPKDFDSLVYLTQVLQAEGMRIGVEHWRRERARTGGALYWQLNDCWPVASWSSIDYFGRWKALQYAARRFYAPVHLSIDDTIKVFELFVTSDITRLWEGEVRWSLETLRGEAIQSGSTPVVAQPLATTHAISLDLGKEAIAPRRDAILVYELWQAGELQERMVHGLIPDKHILFEDPNIQVEHRQDGKHVALRLRASSLARHVELRLEGADVIFSDNYFDLPANRPFTVSFPLPSGWTVERAMTALRIRSVRNTYAA